MKNKNYKKAKKEGVKTHVIISRYLTVPFFSIPTNFFNSYLFFHSYFFSPPPPPPQNFIPLTHFLSTRRLNTPKRSRMVGIIIKIHILKVWRNTFFRWFFAIFAIFDKITRFSKTLNLAVFQAFFQLSSALTS